MHTKTNDELVEMIYAGHDKYDEALQQLIHNLISHNLVLFVLFARHYLSGRWDPFYRQKTV